MGEPNGVGIVGLGTISRAYLAYLATHPEVHVVAVADLDQERADLVAKTLGCVAPGVPSTLAHPDVSVILNLTTPASHAGIALGAVRAGKDVYGEKPFAMTLAEGRLVLGEGARRGVRVGCAPDTVLGTGIQTARDAVERGVIGRPRFATASMIVPGHESWHPDPGFYYRAGGGPLLDMGPYYLSALVHLLGPVVAVSGGASTGRPTRTIGSGPRAGQQVPVEIATHVTAILHHTGGALSTLVTSFEGAATRAAPIEVHGDGGTLEVPDPNGFDGVVRLRRPSDDAWADLEVAAGYRDAARGIGLLDLLRSDRGRAPRASGTLAFHVLEVMLGILESARTGRRTAIRSNAELPSLVPLG